LANEPVCFDNQIERFLPDGFEAISGKGNRGRDAAETCCTLDK